MTRNKMGLRLALDDISLTAGQSVALRTARAPRHFSDLKGTECGVANVSCPTTLRLVVTLLLLLVMGVNEVKADNPIGDGYYMIASNGGPSSYAYSASNPENNFYLCPATACYYNTSGTTFLTTDNGMPHLTTYKSFAHDAVSDAIWHVTSVTVSNTLYYRFYHVASKKYLTYNTGRVYNGNNTRLIVHLEAFTTPDENNTLFVVTASDDKFLIRPKNVTNTSKALNVSSDNLDQTNPGPNKGGIQGTIGYYNISGDDVAASYWYFEVPKPVISYNSSDNKIVITHMDENANIYYTDDDDSDPATTQTENTGTTPLEIPNVNSSVTIKAIAEQSSIVSHVSEIRIVPNATISFGSSPIVYTGSLQEPTVTVKDGDDEISSGEYTVSYSNNNTNAGETVTVTITDNAGGDYIVYGTTTFTINPKPLTITAKPKTITYGDAPTNDGVTYGEFAGEETESVLTGTLTYSYNYAQYGNAGSYKITPGGLSNSNYDITFAPGTLTVNKKSLTVTANNNSITYGEAPAGNGVTYSGFVGEQTAAVLGGSLDYDYSYAQYGDVGNTYTITPKGLSSTNYAFSFVAGTLTVNQREVGIEWGNTSLGYNGSAQVPTATATNVVNNDEITVTVTGAQTDMGTGYTATATGITGAKVGNYVLTSSNTTTTFSIGPGTFTPILSIEGWTYGGTSNAPSVSGNVSGGDVTYSYSVKGENNYSATVPTNAGDYTVKVTIAAKGNYAIVEATTDFTISPKSIGDGNMVAEGITIELTTEGVLGAVKDGETLLTENTDYTQETMIDGQDKLIIVTGKGNYKDSAKGVYAQPVFTDPDGSQSEKAAAVYNAKRDLANPTGITPYIVRKVNPSIGTMVISPLAYIPEDVPVLLLSDAEAAGFVASPKDESTPEITAQTKNSNQLKMAPEGGVDVEAAQTYVFYNGEFVLTKKGTLSAGKFFLYNPNFTATPPAEEEEQQGGAPSLSVLRFVIEEESTGIVEMRNEEGEMRIGSAWYTLDGRKLSGQPNKSGIYIRKGQKMYIKRK